MSSGQIFQTSRPRRWRRVLWTGRLLLFLFFFFLAVLLLAVHFGTLPGIPAMEGRSRAFANAIDASNPLVLNNRQNKRYTTFKNFLFNKEKKKKSHKSSQFQNHSNRDFIRAAFYVPWAPESLKDLDSNGSKLNMIFPEWFFIHKDKLTLDSRIDSAGLNRMKKYGIRILPMLTNFNSALKDFDGKLAHKILTNKKAQDILIGQIIDTLKHYQFQGINVDFEDLLESSPAPFVSFLDNLNLKLKKEGLLLTTDVPPDNNDYDYKSISAVCDYILLMAYDEHSNITGPGPVSGQKWIEGVVSEIGTKLDPGKIILGIAGFGSVWKNGKYSESVTWKQAVARINEIGGDIVFDDNSYNLHYDYSMENEDDSTLTDKYEMWFTDAATIYNVLRFSDEFPLAGTSLWRLGNEDPRMWKFYNRDLSDTALAQNPFDYGELSSIPALTTVNFEGEGEVLDIQNGPQSGLVKMELDTTEQLISEEKYVKLPRGYLIRKFAEDTTVGKGHKLILTFDDGPSAEWTPKILDILEREKVPATFFVVGIQAQQNIPLLRREFNDGFEIGNHTFTHHNIAEMGSERAALEMKLTRLLIESVTGHSTILFRAPYNADSEPTTFEELAPIQASRKENYLTINEGIDPNDWAPGITTDSIVARVIRMVEQNNASIILLHDAGGETREATVKALPKIIDYFKKKGYVFTSVSGLMGKTRDDVMPIVTNRHDRWTANFNFFFAESIYWAGQIVFALFLIGIILSLIKLIFMAVLASIQLKREKSRVLPPIPGNALPGVSVLIPAYNENVNSIKTINSLLDQDYKTFEIIFVDDGSKDNTYELIKNTFADNEKVKVFTKPNGGKASALNFGVEHAGYDYLVCIDADTQLRSDAVSKLMSQFTNEQIGAVAGNVKVGNEVNMITYWQSIEYITSQNFDRRAFDILNCITVVPGAIGAFRKEILVSCGGFTTDTLAEDCDLTMRILKNGYIVRNCADAISYTEAPETIGQFLKQRFRWSFGIMQSFWKHREALFNPRYKNFGLIALPNILIFQILLTMLAPLADLILIVSLLLAGFGIIVASIPHIILYYFIFALVDAFSAALAFAFEKEDYKKLLWLLPQRLVYRQLMYYILLKSIKHALKGEIQHWGTLKRTGNVKDLKTAS